MSAEVIRDLSLPTLVLLFHEAENKDNDVTCIAISNEISRRGAEKQFREEYIRQWKDHAPSTRASKDKP